MTSTRYVSFISGIIIASITWSFSLYLYSKLSQNPNNVNPTMLIPPYSNSYDMNPLLNKTILKNNLIDSWVKDKNLHKKNSDKLIRKLQPVPVKPAVSLGDGNSSINIKKIKNQQANKMIPFSLSF